MRLLTRQSVRVLLGSGAFVSFACGVGAVDLVNQPVEIADAEVAMPSSRTRISAPGSDLQPTRVLGPQLSFGGEPLVADPGLALSLVPEDATPVIGVGYQLSFVPVGGAASNDGPAFQRRFYVAGSLGVSRLEPVSFSDALTVGDFSDFGYRIAIGRDITRWLSAELYFADLGEAGIDLFGDRVGDVDYRAFGLTAIAYVFNTRSGLSFTSAPEGGLSRREGLSLYLSTGLGALDTSSNVPFNQDHDVQVNFGAGLEYGFSNGLAVRADITSFDTDAQLVSVSVLKRFGPSQRSTADRAVPVAPAVAPPAEPQVAQPASPLLLGSNRFAFDQSVLEPEAQRALDQLAAQQRDSDSMLLVGGHTDSTGTEVYNQGLSERRAAAVFDYLTAAGIDASRIVIRGFGELRPRADNDTTDGRAQNRRTEIFTR